MEPEIFYYSPVFRHQRGCNRIATYISKLGYIRFNSGTEGVGKNLIAIIFSKAAIEIRLIFRLLNNVRTHILI